VLERGKGDTRAYGFLMAINLQEHVDLEKVQFALVDAVSWMEGTGRAEVECLGPLDVYNEPSGDEDVERLENEGGPPNTEKE
jgi:hypothetical protein